MCKGPEHTKTGVHLGHLPLRAPWWYTQSPAAWSPVDDGYHRMCSSHERPSIRWWYSGYWQNGDCCVQAHQTGVHHRHSHSDVTMRGDDPLICWQSRPVRIVSRNASYGFQWFTYLYGWVVLCTKVIKKLSQVYDVPESTREYMMRYGIHIWNLKLWWIVKLCLPLNVRKASLLLGESLRDMLFICKSIEFLDHPMRKFTLTMIVLNYCHSIFQCELYLQFVLYMNQ